MENEKRDGDKWIGVLIEESVDSPELLRAVSVASTRSTTLESEEDRGEFSFHNVEVPEDEVEDVVRLAVAGLRPGPWYFHLVRDDVLRVMFRGHAFQARRGDAEAIEAIRQHALTVGVHPDQLPLERLFDDPLS